MIVEYASACLLNVVEFSFVLDDYPEEFAWQVIDANTSELIAGVTQFGVYADVDSFSESACLPSGDYLLVLFDAFGDGFCCDFGTGSADINLVTCDDTSNVVPTISEDFNSPQLVVPFTID